MFSVTWVVYLQHMGRFRARTVAVWLVVAWAVAITIYIGWVTQNLLQEPPSRCGDRPPL